MKSNASRVAANIGILLAVNVLWGSQSTAYKLVGGEMGPIATSLLIYLIAVPSILPLYLHHRRTAAMAPTEQRRWLRWENLSRFVLLGLVASCTMMLMAGGMARTSAANGALLTLTIPIITVLLAAVFLHERMTWARWGCLAVAMLGVFVLSVQPSEAAVKSGAAIDWNNLNLVNTNMMVGNLLVLLGCTGSCLFNVISKSLLNRYSLVEVLLCGYALAVGFDAAMLVATDPAMFGTLFNHTLRTWTGLLLIGAVANGLAMALWLYLLTRMDVSQASVSIYLLPFFGVLQAALFLHEPITLPMIVGGAITLAGTVLTASLDNLSRKRTD